MYAPVARLRTICILISVLFCTIALLLFLAFLGNCLFRSVSHQIYGDVSHHARIRQECYDYMERDRDFFSSYVAEDFDTYIARQRQLNEWGDHVEIVALREMFNKNVEIYDKLNIREPKSLDTSGNVYDVPVMRLSFHGNNHYNSVIDPKQAPPLGDGHDSKINMRLVRIEHEKRLVEEQKQKIAEINAKAKAKEKEKEFKKQSDDGNDSDDAGSVISTASVDSHTSSTVPIASIPNSTHTQRLSTDSLLSLFRKVDSSHTGSIDETQLSNLLSHIITALYFERAQTIERTQGGSLRTTKLQKLQQAYEQLNQQLLSKLIQRFMKTLDSSSTHETENGNRYPIISSSTRKPIDSTQLYPNGTNSARRHIRFDEFVRIFNGDILDSILWNFAQYE